MVLFPLINLCVGSVERSPGIKKIVRARRIMEMYEVPFLLWKCSPIFKKFPQTLGTTRIGAEWQYHFFHKNYRYAYGSVLNMQTYDCYLQF